MSKIIIYNLLFLFAFSSAGAQEGNNWYFGYNAGLTFNTPVPMALTDGMLSTYEGCATMSDKNGQLLFYTDGKTVWNKHHQPMPNGTGLYGDSSSSNAAIIIPKPGSLTIYYIFTSDSQENQNVKGYNYTEVDISLDNGLGAVTSNKNVLLYAPCSEKLTAVRDANGTDIWVITHEWGSNVWRSFKVTCNGINTTSVNSSVGLVYKETMEFNGTTFNIESVGCLKASPDGKKIATTDVNSQKWEIFDFDNATGKLSNVLGFYEYDLYGIEFSSNSRLLYVANKFFGYEDSCGIKQFDVSIHDSITITSSMTQVAVLQMGISRFDNLISALQLGPDNKIYCAVNNDSALAVINNPDAKGGGCNFIPRQINLKGRVCQRGLPVFFPSLITNKNIDFNFSAGNNCATVVFSAHSSINNITQWLWDFGDGQTETGQNVTHTYVTDNEYDAQLTVVVNNVCGGGTASTAKKINLIRTKPKSGFSFDTKCGDKSVALVDSSKILIGNIVQWNWDFGDGHTSDLASPIHSYGEFGKYNVSLITASDGACNGSDTTTKVVIVNAKPLAQMDITNACVNKKTIFKDISIVEKDTIAGRNWVFSDGQNFTEAAFERLFTTPDTYNIKMAVESGAGCVSDTIYTTVTIETIPEAKFSYGIACVDSLVSFKDESVIASGNITMWHWDFGDGTSDNQPNAKHQYASAGSYTIRLVATSSQLCSSDTLSKVIQIDSKPIASFSLVDGCVGKQIIPVNNSASSTGDIKDYFWNLGAGYTVSGETPPLVFNNSGDNTVTLITKTIHGCVSDPFIKSVYIESNPEVDFLFGNTCVEEAIQFNNNSSNKTGDIVAWHWNFADGGISLLSEPSYTYKKFGNYEVVLEATTKNGCSDTAKRTITIVKVNVWAGNDTVIAKGQPLQLNATGAINYQWQPASYLNNSSINNPMASLSSDIRYYLTGVTAQGCLGYDSINIKVYNGPDIYVPTAFTPNGDMLNDRFKPILPGIKQLISFSIYNRWGQLVYQTRTIGQGWDGMLNGNAVPTGTYVWTLTAIDYNNQMWNKKGSVTVLR